MTHEQGDKLRKARENSHFTQQQVADALGVDRSMLLMKSAEASPAPQRW